ncbi:MAG: hypothetical protein K5899_01030 [Bacteroidaceae bacterium]|nr:hypothetical protein [Bacteroidaceae bacterium]
MIELYLSKVTETSESEQAGKLYARVSYKQTLGVTDMARHMAEHNTAFSEGLITGILIDFVRCVREQVLNGNTVKIDNLAIFKATVEANALETLYDAQQDKVAQATIGQLAEGAKTGPAVKTIKLLAQSTGDFTRDELRKDVKLGWTDKAKAEIAAAKGEDPSGSNENQNQGGNSGGSGNSGSSVPTLTISKTGSGTSAVTVGGNAVNSGSQIAAGTEVALSVTPAEGQTPTATLNGSSVTLTESDGTYTGTFQMPSGNATLVINSGSTGGGGGVDQN